MRATRVVALLGVVFSGCGTEYERDSETTDTPRMTWHQDVAPIIAAHCMSCHQDGGIAPFSLTDFASAVENAPLMLDAVEHGIMPPFDAREEADCTPERGWKDDPRLSTSDKATLRAWIDDGLLEGTPAAVNIPATPELANITTTLAPAQGFVTSGNRDQFMCFVLDPGTTQIGWLTGMQVRPGNALVVHHAVITQVAQAEGATLVAQHGLGQPFECSTTPGNFIMHIWTPGNQPMQTDGDLAIPMLPGAKIVMQIHYHPAGVTNDIDVTKLDLQFSSTWPRKMYFVSAVGNAEAAPNLEPGPGDNGTPRFFIPRNSAAHTESMSAVITGMDDEQSVHVYSVNPHMHLVGTHISSTIERAVPGSEPAKECLANGAWNFDWQRTYTYDSALDDLPTIKNGDRISVTCKWNNTLDNPFVQRMLLDSHLPMQAIDITLGEQTTNEMCLEIFGIALDAPANPAAIRLPMLGVMPTFSSLFAQ